MASVFKPKQEIKRGKMEVRGKITLRSLHTKKRNWSQVCCWREVSAGLIQTAVFIGYWQTYPRKETTLLDMWKTWYGNMGSFICSKNSCSFIWLQFGIHLKIDMQMMKIGVYEMKASPWLDKPLTPCITRGQVLIPVGSKYLSAEWTKYQ